MRFVHCALLAIWLCSSTAQAEWAKKDYSSEYDNCLPPCDKNNPKEHEMCVKYCGCVTDGMQGQFADHNQMTREVMLQKMPERIASLQKIANGCNHKYWGNPAQKLKFQ